MKTKKYIATLQVEMLVDATAKPVIDLSNGKIGKICGFITSTGKIIKPVMMLEVSKPDKMKVQERYTTKRVQMGEYVRRQVEESVS